MSSVVNDVLNLIKQNSVKFIDFRFTDLCGRWYHKTYKADANEIESILLNRIMIGGEDGGYFIPHSYKYVYQDIALSPDLSTAFLDPFYVQTTLVILCNIMKGDSQEHEYDPRSVAKKAHEYMLKSGIADQAYFNPEIGFHIFDDVKYNVDWYCAHFKLNLIGENNLNKRCEGGKYRLTDMIISPNDQLHDIRSEILEMMSEVGIKPLSHYLGDASSKCEIEFGCDEFLCSADNVQKFKHVVRNVASSYGKTATFMPLPVKGERSNMRCNQFLQKNNENLFFDKNGDESETGLYYIGGIVKHIRAINAFTNPATNSYANYFYDLGYSYNYYSSAAVKILRNKKIIQSYFPDAIANPYLCFAVQLMAGLDGIKNKIHPGDNVEKLQTRDTTCESLKEALDELRCDREFLLQEDVFSEKQIDEYIKIKEDEIRSKELAIHPIEFINYYNL